MTTPKHDNSLYAGGVTYPLGFRASGVAAGLKQSGTLDMALIASDSPAVVAGAFTANRFRAAPVTYCEAVLGAGNPVRAVVTNSGNANAATGPQGDADARTMAESTAKALGCRPAEILVCSTGKIGVPMPMDIVRHGIAQAGKALSENGGNDAADAIMTTDTRPKTAEETLCVDGCEVRLGGMAKGAGMIAPQLVPAGPPHATMLATLTTDAAVAPRFLRACLAECLDESFNRVTIDGDTSTNDTFLALANGAAGNAPLDDDHPQAGAFKSAFTRLAASLARQMVLDGEGATRFVAVTVSGARTRDDACVCASAIANSLLCKTAWFGGDPNWGRVVDAAGYAGIDLDPARVSLDYNRVPIVRNGMDAGTTKSDQADAVKGPEIDLCLDLGVGDGQFTVWTCDISYDYVKINAEYHT